MCRSWSMINSFDVKCPYHLPGLWSCSGISTLLRSGCGSTSVAALPASVEELVFCSDLSSPKLGLADAGHNPVEGLQEEPQV